MVMSDLGGHLTTRLNAAYQPLKDNRLLPTGFRVDHTVFDTVATWGNVNEDPDFTTESNNGLDRIEYRIPLSGRTGLADLSVSLPVSYTHLASRMTSGKIYQKMSLL